MTMRHHHTLRFFRVGTSFTRGVLLNGLCASARVNVHCASAARLRLPPPALPPPPLTAATSENTEDSGEEQQHQEEGVRVVMMMT